MVTFSIVHEHMQAYSVLRLMAIVCTYSFLVITAINSMSQFGLMIKVIQIQLNTTPNSFTTITALIDFVNTFVQGIRVLEYIILLYGFSLFLCKMDSTMLKELGKALISRRCRITLVIIVLLIIYFAMLFVSPSLDLLMHMRQNMSSHGTHTDPYFYSLMGTLYASHITNGAIRAAMIITVLLITEAWKSAKCNLSNQLQCHNAADDSTLREYFTTLITNYTTTGRLVSSMNTIFQGWFVIQWATYFIGTTVSFALLFDTIIETNLKYDPSLLDILAQIVYYISALAIPYACGVIINNSHRDYREYLEEKQKEFLSQNQDFRVYIMQTASLIPIKSDYLFIPSLCGLSIPLNSNGHSITILLTLLAFILGLISKFD